MWNFKLKIWRHVLEDVPYHLKHKTVLLITVRVPLKINDDAKSSEGV
jgi:hypothetical protein